MREKIQVQMMGMKILTSKVTIDFETRSEADIKKTGGWTYSLHETTDVLCLSYRIPGRPKGIWVPSVDPGFPEDLKSAIDSVLPFEAHNSQFELAIWENVMVKKYQAPIISRDRWTCSAAKAAALSLPRNLENLALALHLPVQKDMEGRRLMLKMTRPKKKTKKEPEGGWHEDPQDLVRLIQYCHTDTETEELASELMPELSKNEQILFLLDQKINLRGLYIDIPLVKICLDFIDRYSVVLLKKLQDLTDGEIQTAGQRQKILDYLSGLGTDLQNKLAATFADILGGGGVKGKARQILEVRQKLSKSSTTKFKTFLNATDPNDNRVRGTMLYHGASTGRWSGRLIQPHNFPRGSIKDVNECIDTLKMNDYELFKYLYPDVMGAISSCLRGMITAPVGRDLIAADFASIESRVLFWLANEKTGLQIYKTHGKAYEDMASFIYNKPIDAIKKDSMERQLGKAAILGCGFQMGKIKFYDTCHDWGIPVTKAQAAMGVDGFRKRFPKVVKFWYALNDAAIAAVENPGLVTEVGLIKFKHTGGFLYCRLPNGRKIAYREPIIKEEPTRFGVKKQVSFMGTNSKTKKWERQRTYGGKLAENIVQATARDFMADGMLRVEKKGYYIVMTVHDEIICEVPEEFGSVEEFEKLMATVPTWGKGCPIGVEGWRGKRFKK